MPAPDDEWVVVVRERGGGPLKVYRGREQIDAEDVAALSLGLATETERLRLLLGEWSHLPAAVPPPSLPPPRQNVAARLFDPPRRFAIN